MSIFAELQNGKYKGRKMIIPNVVLVSQGKFVNGGEQFSKFCLEHDKFIPDNGCDECKKNERHT
jgi:hypothetical protein